MFTKKQKKINNITYLAHKMQHTPVRKLNKYSNLIHQHPCNFLNMYTTMLCYLQNKIGFVKIKYRNYMQI